MNRRNFLYKTAAVTSLAGVGSVAWSNTMINRPSNSSKFQLNYAPAFEAFQNPQERIPSMLLNFAVIRDSQPCLIMDLSAELLISRKK